MSLPGVWPGPVSTFDSTKGSFKNLKMKLTDLTGFVFMNLDGKLAATNGVLSVALEPIEE